MAEPMRESLSEIARLLNLNQYDTNAFSEVINEYFSTDDVDNSTSDDDVSSASEDDDVPQNDDADSFLAVTSDPAEYIIPLNRGHQPPESPTPPPLEDGVSHPGTNDCSPELTATLPCLCKGSPCYGIFSRDQIEECRLQYLSLDKDELDISLLSKIACGIHLEDETRNTKHSKQTQRKASRTDYMHHGHKICREFFKYLHSIGQDKLSALLKHYRAKGVEARVHKNKKKLPKNALQYMDTRRVVDFILNYAETNAISLPGRTNKHWSTDIQLLPTDTTKKMVYELYKTAAETDNVRTIKLRTFQHLWKTLVPFVKTMPPASDLCLTCQQGASRLLNTNRNFSTVMEELQQHQAQVKKEREFYTQNCIKIKEQIPPHLTLGRHRQCSFDGQAHFSFDFAQQMHYPHDPRQPGPIYFKTPRKCGLFGVNCEAMKTQINYLIDEAHSSGKGANVVISYLHDALENHGLGETNLHLHADNCAGQNKNSAMMWYLLWRCMTGRHQRIQISFLITGHTKFSPDGGFGLIKRKLKVTRVDCLNDIADMVNTSAQMNMAKLVGTEQGPTEIPTFDWAAYLGNFFSKVKAIKGFHHFCVDSTGMLRVKQFIDSPEQTQQLLKRHPPANGMPDIIPPQGLSTQRQWYLYREIRPFVADAKKDTVTPLPTHVQILPSSSSDDSESDTDEPSSKRQRPEPATGTNRGRGSGRGRGRGRGTPMM